MTVTAFFVDGDFFLRRHRKTFGENRTPEQTAKDLFGMCLDHLEDKEKGDLYRILFYDCAPLSKKAQNPVSRRAVDFAKSDLFAFRTALHKALVKQRKVALRLGRLNDGTAGWRIKPKPTKALLAKKIAIDDLTENDVAYEVQQKGVDMRMGLDVAAIAFKQYVRRIVLVTGDADFVPAAKFARREGIDVILDPMWQPVGEDLHVHIDGLRSVCRRPKVP